MIKHLIILITMVLAITCSYGQNLILNGSFEDLKATGIGITKLEHWVIPQYASPDLFLPTVTPEDWSSSDTNAIGYQLPKHGLNYVGGRYFISGTGIPSNSNREPIIAKTDTLLITNQQYCFSFYISLSDKINCGTNRLDAMFSSTPFDPIVNGPPYFNYSEPNLIFDSTQFYVDKMNWTKVEGIYTASGGENYITIGNLHLDNSTDTLCNGDIDGFPGQKIAYYYMDNFSLEEIKPIVIGNDKNITAENSTVIGNNSDSASTYTWTPNYFIDDTNAVNPTVNPPQTTTYYVTKTQCNITTSDSITVYVHPVGVSEYYNNTSFNIYPNPNKGIFNFNYTVQQEAQLVIYNLMGQEVKTVELPSTKNLLTINMSGYSNGVYTYKVIEKSKLISVSKFMIK